MASCFSSSSFSFLSLSIKILSRFSRWSCRCASLRWASRSLSSNRDISPSRPCPAVWHVTAEISYNTIKFKKLRERGPVSFSSPPLCHQKSSFECEEAIRPRGFPWWFEISWWAQRGPPRVPDGGVLDFAQRPLALWNVKCENGVSVRKRRCRRNKTWHEMWKPTDILLHFSQLLLNCLGVLVPFCHLLHQLPHLFVLLHSSLSISLHLPDCLETSTPKISNTIFLLK